MYHFKLCKHWQKAMVTDLQRNFKDEANNWHLDKEVTRWSKLNSRYLNVILVSKYPDFFCLFSSCSISLLLKQDLILRYGAWAKPGDRTRWGNGRTRNRKMAPHVVWLGENTVALRSQDTTKKDNRQGWGIALPLKYLFFEDLRVTKSVVARPD